MAHASSTATQTKPTTAQKDISILGVTGSIGQSTLQILREHPDKFSLNAITAQNNVDGLIAAAREFSPSHVVIGNDAHYTTLKQTLADTPITVSAGEDALIAAAAEPADMLVAAIVGLAGLKPTLAAIRQGTDIALANKECLVSAGDVFMQACQKFGSALLPVDSEHNAIFQVFDTTQTQAIEKLTLTASGGPFRNFSAEQLQNVTPAQAVKHPNWSMGAKISVDSASMMNKGLEVIEAARIFPIAPKDIAVVVHPESIIHSMVHYTDGSVLAQMGMPSMQTPIAYCLAYPQRIKTSVDRLDLATIGKLTFDSPDVDRFPCLQLALDALHAGKAAPTILNAANEIAVAAFLDGEIKFNHIASVIETCLERCETSSDITSIDDVLSMDEHAREVTAEIINK